MMWTFRHWRPTDSLRWHRWRQRWHHDKSWFSVLHMGGIYSHITKFMGPTWGPPGSCRSQMGPMLAPWTLLHVSGLAYIEAETQRLPFCRRHFQLFFFNENVSISIKVSLDYVPKAPIDSKWTLAQIMAWGRTSDKQLSESTVTYRVHWRVTRQWVNIISDDKPSLDRLKMYESQG